jgi:hypothetical protein
VRARGGGALGHVERRRAGVQAALGHGERRRADGGSAGADRWRNHGRAARDVRARGRGGARAWREMATVQVDVRG